MSAPTISRSGLTFHDASNSRIRKIGLMTGPTSYTTGGDAFDSGALGLGKVDVVLMEPFYNGTIIAHGRYNVSTAKMQFFVAAGTEVANGTNLSAYTARFEAIGY